MNVRIAKRAFDRRKIRQCKRLEFDEKRLSRIQAYNYIPKALKLIYGDFTQSLQGKQTTRKQGSNFLSVMVLIRQPTTCLKSILRRYAAD